MYTSNEKKDPYDWFCGQNHFQNVQKVTYVEGHIFLVVTFNA